MPLCVYNRLPHVPRKWATPADFLVLLLKMTLRNAVRELERKVSKVGRVTAGVAVYAASLIGGYSAKAEVINIDNTWTGPEVTRALDGNPGTTGKDGIDAVDGDAIVLAAGNYHPAFNPSDVVMYRSGLSNITVTGAGEGSDPATNTIFFGPDLFSSVIWENSGDNVTFS